MKKEPKKLDEFERINNQMPTSYESYEYLKQKKIQKQIRQYNNKDISPEDFPAVKARAYELIIKGNSSSSFIPILADEFDVPPTMIKTFVDEFYLEVKTQYEEINNVLRESILLDIFKMKNEAKTINEKLKCYDLIIKLTGLATSTVNVNSNENRTFIINAFKDDENKKG